MYIFKTTTDILQNKWPTDSNFKVDDLPKKYHWLNEEHPTVDDIDIWEQVYSQPGNVGIYAAWSPFVEVYLIVYPQLLDTDYGIETYYSVEEVLEKAKELNINLPVNAIWI